MPLDWNPRRQRSQTGTKGIFDPWAAVFCRFTSALACEFLSVTSASDTRQTGPSRPLQTQHRTCRAPLRRPPLHRPSSRDSTAHPDLLLLDWPQHELPLHPINTVLPIGLSPAPSVSRPTTTAIDRGTRNRTVCFSPSSRSNCQKFDQVANPARNRPKGAC